MNGRANKGYNSVGWAICVLAATAFGPARMSLTAADRLSPSDRTIAIPMASGSASQPTAPHLQDASPPPQLELLDGRTIACRAAQRWTPAQALRARGKTVIAAYQREDDCARQAAQVIATFLSLQACQQEDLAAANGLRAYYTRIAVAEQLQLGSHSRQMLAEEASKLQSARQSGWALGTDPTDIERRGIEIDDQQLQLRSQDQQLRSALAQLTDCDYEMSAVQQEQLDVQPARLDCEQLVAIALSERCDLRSWKCLSQHMNPTSAPIFAQLLTTSVGAFGLPIPPIVGLKHLLCSPDQTPLASGLQSELKLMLETLRRAIQLNVQEKCAKLELAYGRLELAQATVASWQSRRDQLQQLEELGRPDPEQSARAQVGWMQARAAELSRRLEAKLAEVDLAEAVGQLAHRCCAGQAWLVTGL